jgi:uncharacterized membrane protein
MATRSKQESRSTAGDLMSELPLDRLKDEVVELGKAMAQRGLSKLGEGMSGATDKIGDIADAAPGPGDVAKAALKVGSPLASVKDAAGKVKDALPGTGSGDDGDGGKAKNSVGDDTDLKVTNIVESIDVPVPRDVAYQLWTQFEEFPSFMKKVEAVNQKDPEVLTWKAQIFWSHRTWTAKIVDQVPPERIVWKSEADKGKVDGAVTFHELAPDLTRVLVSLEYHPQGLFERTGNLWRAQGRRVRVELKHFRRHVANHALINQDDVDGWEGEIHDGKVKRRRSSSAAKKSSSSGSTAKKSTAKKSASNGSTAKKSTAKKSTSNGSTAKKSTSSGSTAKKSTSSSSTARKSTAKKSTTRKSTARKSPATKTAKKSTARKSGSGSATKRTAAASKRSSTTSARAASRGRSSGRKKS